MKLPIIFLLLASALPAGALPPEQVEFFESHIRPVLAQECYECHSTAGKRKGGLLLDSREGWMTGGDSGEVILPGNPKESLLLQSIRHEDPDLKMPSKGAKLEPRILENFEKWIAMGAPDPRDRPPTKEELTKDTDWNAVRERRKGWWSFQPITDPEPSIAVENAWSSHTVDRFLLAAMEKEELRPAAEGDPSALLRRLSFVLTGMAPTREETRAFAEATSRDPQAAWEAAVDRLLASPRFGEKWARHWMDWVRYAETHGSEGDPQIPFAWRYRDYLIRALNADVPLPQLIREHIAGDLLEQPRVHEKLGINESAIGAAHYRMVLHGFTPTDALDEQATFTDNQIDTLTKTFLGLTVSCARCHDHKFDAISQTDFYALYGVMASGRPATIDANLPERQTQHTERLAPLKERIRHTLAAAWLTRIDAAGQRLRAWKLKDDKEKAALAKGDTGALAAWLRLTALPPEQWEAEWRREQHETRKAAERLEAFRKQPAQLHWDLRSADRGQWLADGAGLSRGASPAGEFRILPEGDRAIAGVFPAGIYSHLLTDKHRAVLQSPPFPAEGGKLWLRIRGEGNASARYVVRNYPRTGTIYQKAELNSANDQWIHWPLEYWKGDTLYVEITTEADQPVETRNAERSWFGVAEVLLSKDANAPAPPVPGAPLQALCDDAEPAPRNADELAALYMRVLRQCVEAWQAGQMNDTQAEFLGQFLRLDLLPNRLADLPEAAPLIAEYRQIEADVPMPTRVPGVLEGFAFDQSLFVRGDHKQPGEPVPRRFLESIDPTPFLPGEKQSGRRELAERFIAPENPFTTRVVANRIWHHVFGRGLVATPDNFGRLGEQPTHPELLDHLATRLQREGGSLKQLIRYLVTTRAFRLDSRAAPESAERDPENKLLSHFSSRRLDAEAIRDSMLALTGRIDCSDGAPADGGSYRRSVYTRVIRNNLDPFLSAFDFPVPAATRGRRDSTNVPAQALAMLNDPAVIRWAGDWARRILADPQCADDSARVHQMFAEAFARQPSGTETEQSLAFLRSLADEGLERDHAWRSFAQAIFNTKEFLYLR